MPAMLREDALSSEESGIVRLSMPWIRSLPVWCIHDVSLWVDGTRVPTAESRVRLGERTVSVADLAEEESTWWFVQDRLVVELPDPVEGPRNVRAEVTLTVPYLASPTGDLLVARFHDERILVADAPCLSQDAGSDVGGH